MAKNLHNTTMAELKNDKLNFLSIERRVKQNEDGGEEPFIRVALEIEKENEMISKYRFSCKSLSIQFGFGTMNIGLIINKLIFIFCQKY